MSNLLPSFGQYRHVIDRQTNSPPEDSRSMVERQLAFSILQLVALSLPAFAILLQMVVESNFPYTGHAVLLTTASMGLFLIAGAVVLGERFFATTSPVTQMALGTLVLGILGLLLGSGLIGLQTHRAQQRHANGNE